MCHSQTHNRNKPVQKHSHKSRIHNTLTHHMQINLGDISHHMFPMQYAIHRKNWDNHIHKIQQHKIWNTQLPLSPTQKPPYCVHFNLPSHSIDNAKITGIEIIHTQSRDTILHRESFWISKLKTLHPLGINVTPWFVHTNGPVCMFIIIIIKYFSL